MGLSPSLASCLAMGVFLFHTYHDQDAVGHEDYEAFTRIRMMPAPCL